ncbi:MAG: macrolide ABC transporter ATP-binding protein [Firmicutes bacterium HGW-Firmicutes-7]|nr:MAG: macrolide ABC transporter ATP-binding protein [Firmicutes bacterium HGW-Firmicutes-7]
MIRINELSKKYEMGDNVLYALDHLSIHIKEHEFVAIIGPSGSGKSTLMNIIGCLDSPSEGKYSLNNIEVSKFNGNELAEIRNFQIGFIFQGYNLVKKLTALENVELPLIYAGIHAKERHVRAKAALESVGLSERLHHMPSELSGGQQQRVAIARALVLDPPLLLADEPTGNLDSKSEVEILNIFKELNAKGNTIVVITHDDSVAKIANRIIRLKDGKLEQESEVIEDELTTSV